MSLKKLEKLVTSLAKSVDNHEKLATPILAAKLAKYTTIYPHDQTLGSMSRVIEKMAENNTLFIRKAELKSLYNKLYTRNTKFAELFQDEMLDPDEARRAKWRQFSDEHIGTKKDLEDWMTGNSSRDEKGLPTLPPFPKLVASILAKDVGEEEATKLVAKHWHIINQYVPMIGGKEDLEHQAHDAARHLLSTVQTPKESFGDPVLANALESVFSGGTVKMYSQALADYAIKSVASTLDAWNLKPSTLAIDDGNDKFLMIRADYETPKGVTSFFVPVEIRNNKLIEASVLLGNAGVQDLNYKTIKSYITSNAGTKLKAQGSSVLQFLTQAASENREISDTELALTRLHAERQGKSEFFHNQIVGQKVAEIAVKDVILPKYGGFESFEEQFTSPYGVASYTFGEDKIKIARENINRELATYGHKNIQIVVTSNDQNTIFYGISLDAGRIAFTVPVKVVDGKLTKPGIILCNGSIIDFNKAGIDQLYVNNQSEFKTAAVASPMYSLKPSELIQNIKTAMHEGNTTKAEDALNVLSQSDDSVAYITGFQIFMQGLSGKKVEAEKECSMIVKNSTSEHPICGHTGLPVHKTYRDKDGNCRPLYRQGMEEGYEAATFMNHKIFG